jgi:hypothetical protein
MVTRDLVRTARSRGWRRIDVLLFDGQSNSIGGGGATGTPSVINTSPLTVKALMPNTGIAQPRAIGSTFNFAGKANRFVPAVEVQFNSQTAESPATRTLFEIYDQRRLAGETQRLLFAHGIGAGGQTIAGLDNGTDPATNAVNFVTKFIALCRREKYIPHVTIAWLQGEAQTSDTAAAYSAALQGRLTFYDTYLLPLVQALVPSHGAFHMLCGQLSINANGIDTDVPYGFLQAAIAEPRIHIATPTYMVEKEENVHYSAVGHQYLAAHFAQAYREYRANGSVKFLRMVSAVKVNSTTYDTTWTDHPTDDSIIQITNGPLSLSSPYVAAITGAGFSFGDGVLAASASVTAATTIRVVAASAPTAGTTIRYALSNGTTAILNAAGNVVDSRTGNATYDGSALPRFGCATRVTPT